MKKVQVIRAKKGEVFIDPIAKFLIDRPPTFREWKDYVRRRNKWWMDGLNRKPWPKGMGNVR